MFLFFSFFHLSVYYNGVELNNIVLKHRPHTLKMHNSHIEGHSMSSKAN